MKVSHNDIAGGGQFFSLVYLYDEVWRRDVSRQGSEVDSSLLMRRQLRIVLVIQRDARQGSSDGSRVAGVHFLEYNWEENIVGQHKAGLGRLQASRGGIWRNEKE